MGREIRMVPENWDHPLDERGNYQSMFDETYESARTEWLDGLAKWEAGKDPDREKYKPDDHNGTYDWWEWHGSPPERKYYRPWKKKDATWYQLWETVSEGSPVSPPFATKDELVEHLSKHGDEWDQKRCKDPDACRLFGLTFNHPGWGIEKASRFVYGNGWAPSMVFENGDIKSGVDFVTQKAKNE